MKIPFLSLLLSALSFLPICSLLAEGPLGSPSRPVSDTEVRSSFEKKLSALKKEGALPEPESLISQLKERKAMEEALSLPTEPSDPDEPNHLRRAKNASLIFGRLYLCGKCDKWHPSLAGGVVISADGIAVTNHHVIDGDGSVAFGAMTPDGKVHPVAEVLASSKARDLAIIRLEGENFDYAPLSPDLAVGDDLFVVSHPDGRFFSFSDGAVSRYYHQRQRNGKPGAVFMEITADFAKGSSGSGVFDSEGRLAGLVASTNSIYYDKKDGVETNLQMVIKSCVPVAAIRTLATPAK